VLYYYYKAVDFQYADLNFNFVLIFILKFLMVRFMTIDLPFDHQKLTSVKEEYPKHFKN